MARSSAATITPASGSLTLASARIVFEPTAYDGSGETNRANLVLGASEEELSVVRAWEESTDGVQALCSALTPNGLKAKLGKATVRCWEDNKLTTLLETLNDKNCQAVIRLTGCWETKTQRGLCVRVTDLQVIAQEIESPFGP